MVADVEKDCTFNNSAIVSACQHADKFENFEQPCEKGKDTFFSEGGGIDLSTFDWTIYTIAELLDLKRRYDAGEFDNYGAEEQLHPFLEKCKSQCLTEEIPTIRMDPTMNDMTAISGSGRLFKDN